MLASDIKFAKSMVLTCCALHNLYESHGVDFHQDWNTSSEEPVLVIAAQDIEEECSEIRQAFLPFIFQSFNKVLLYC